ncbi:hypothetical protein [Pseudobacillus badius]|uniref:hypothetical protein n=1 Tax=Bacillus badius TaxID=1455 RepID=UPI0007B39CCF|nr:hypothetical protein [Bacillus badius]KZR57512.1 hypothetical protein A3781_19660 [Bacillus badius]
MKHIAKRLVPYADDNKIIHIDSITDVALRKLAKDRSINHLIRSSLKTIDDQLELLIPYQVDDKEQQLKRYIQDKMGLVVNLSELNKKHSKHYRMLLEYGSPTDVIKRWGLDYTYSRNINPEQFQDLLGGLAAGQEKTIRRLYSTDRKLYMAILHQARKEGLSVKEYVERLGYTYE